MLEEFGPACVDRPHTLSGNRASKHQQLRFNLSEALRILSAFDPKRSAYLILRGDKTGDANWYLRDS